MSTRTNRHTIALAVIVFGIAAAGSGIRVADAQPIPCPGASCDVVVTMEGTTPRAYDLQMGKGNKNAEIVWKLQAPGYEFRADSIKPHTAPPSGGKQTTTQAAWDDQMRLQNYSDTTYRMKNDNTAAGTLYYDIKVYQKSTGVAYTLDPAIINDP